MEEKVLIPFWGCFTANLTDNIIALHETGHVITMYALGMMDYFEYVTIKAGNGTLGLTEVTDEYKAIIAKHSKDVIQAPLNMHYGKDIARTLQLSKLESAKLYFPNICRLFGGGAICRFYHIPDENLCKIDYALIDTLLAGLGLMVKSSDIQPLVDQYLNPIFASFDLLTKAVYTNLVEFGTLHKEQVMQIIKEWEEYKLL
jgi:hypothetical protein